MSDGPWYRDGLRFQCTACGDCCTGDPGAVWVNEEELVTLAAQLGVTPQEFEKTYVRQLGTRKSLMERFNGDCVLFDAESRRCTVYAARPMQCRAWPFWSQNVETPAAWAATRAVCPGSGQGALHPVSDIVARLRALREARER